jgi:TolB protein
VDSGARRWASVVAGVAIVALLAAVVVAVVTPAKPAPGETPSLAAAALASESPTAVPEASGAAGASPPAPTDVAGGATAPPTPSATLAAGRIAYIDGSGALAVVGGEAAVVSLAVTGVTFGPPAWSPDGTRVAAIGTAASATGIYVFDVPPVGRQATVSPRVVYTSADHAPFYLYWSPDGARVGFLANEDSAISLRVAMADGSRPTDGPRHDGVLRVGAPLYFTWEDARRLMLHVGVGPDAFAGEIDLTGKAARGVHGTGNFRAAGVSNDARILAYVDGDAAAADLVSAERDGSGSRRVPVFGPTAMAFDPAGDTLAWIAADRAEAASVGLPFGPLRVLDASTGATRTLVEDAALTFFWSPDGRTIAVLRLGAAGGPTAGSGRIVTAMSNRRLRAAAATGQGELMRLEAAETATPEPAQQVHLTFVDVATGSVRSDRTVEPAPDYVNTVLPYFDQYALSHRVWSPDGASIALPLVDSTGRARVTVLDVDGTDPGPLVDGIEASWAP